MKVFIYLFIFENQDQNFINQQMTLSRFTKEPHHQGCPTNILVQLKF